MQLPHPLARLANCCWLPRHVAKARHFLRGELPFSYRVAYGARTSVDGYFFRHFALSKQINLNAVRSSSDDAAVVAAERKVLKLDISEPKKSHSFNLPAFWVVW